eukprot:scaffold115_cov304-Prasinococcus_capsulatus_cf.AAC.56
MLRSLPKSEALGAASALWPVDSLCYTKPPQCGFAQHALSKRQGRRYASFGCGKALPGSQPVRAISPSGPRCRRSSWHHACSSGVEATSNSVVGDDVREVGSAAAPRTATARPTLVLLDCMPVCYRAYHGFKRHAGLLRASSGEPTSVLYGFVSFIRNVSPNEAACCMMRVTPFA